MGCLFNNGNNCSWIIILIIIFLLFGNGNCGCGNSCLTNDCGRSNDCGCGCC